MSRPSNALASDWRDLEEDIWRDDAGTRRDFDPTDDDPVALELSHGGGESRSTVAKYEEPCAKCGGSGRFVGYTGRVLGRCFKCDGKGTLVFKTSPETRAKRQQTATERKARKAQRIDDDAASYLEANPSIAQWFSRNQNWEFCSSLLDSLRRYGSLTEKQHAAAAKCAEKMVARDAEREVETNDPDALDLSDLPSGYYAVPDGETRLKLRVRLATTGKWAGWTFVDDGAVYGSQQAYGRQAPGKRYTGKCVEALRAILADPREATAEYGRLTGTCGVCGRKLEDEESVARGIGPVCAQRF